MTKPQVGVVAAVIPDPPELSVYWLRDACLVYHPWLNEHTVLGETSLRPMGDDMTRSSGLNKSSASPEMCARWYRVLYTFRTHPGRSRTAKHRVVYEQNRPPAVDASDIMGVP